MAASAAAIASVATCWSSALDGMTIERGRGTGKEASGSVVSKTRRRERHTARWGGDVGEFRLFWRTRRDHDPSNTILEDKLNSITLNSDSIYIDYRMGYKEMNIKRLRLLVC